MLSMKRRIIKPGLLSIVAIALVALLSSVIIACTEALVEPYDPFSVRLSYAELKGYTDGFMPGNTYEFDLTIRNDTEEQWQGQYCVFLVNQNDVVLKLGDDAFTLSPQGSFTRKVQMALLADFEEGAYGLSLVVPDRGASVTTIHVGKDNDKAAGPWPDVTSCPE